MEEDSNINWKERYYRLEQELGAKIKELEAKIQELLEKLNTNSKNSSKPPSQDPFRVSRKAKSTGKKPGGQPGHPGHQRKKYDEVTKMVDLKPVLCPKCNSTEFEEQPIFVEHRQVIELPKIQPEVTQYNIHTCRCSQCKKHVRSEIPKEAEHGFGPRLMAFVTMLTGDGSVTKRKICTITSHLGLKISLGGLCNIHKLASKVLEKPFQEVRARVMGEVNVNGDETSWRFCNQRCWLWIAATPTGTFFKIDPSRSQEAFSRVFGNFQNTLTSDRYGAYNIYKGRKQSCLSHIKRDIEKMMQRSKEESVLGRIFEWELNNIFKLWYSFKSGTLSRTELQTQSTEHIENIKATLTITASAEGISNRSAAFALDLLNRFSTLWTFLEQEGVEPTNNLAERGLRPAVIFRKICGGSRSEWGIHFIERLFTVTYTLKQYAKNVFEFLTRCFEAYIGARAPPSIAL